MEIKFNAYQPNLTLFRTDGMPARVDVSISMNEYDKVKDIPLLPRDVMYEITIKQVEEQ